MQLLRPRPIILLALKEQLAIRTIIMLSIANRVVAICSRAWCL